MNGLTECGLLAAIGDIVRLCLGSILLGAGLSKLRKLPDVSDLLQVLGLKVTRPRVLSIMLVGFEISVGVWLLTGIAANAALVLTSVLLMILTVLMWVLVHKGYRGSCACFGTMDNYSVGPIQIGRNLSLFAISLFASVESFRPGCVEPAIWQTSVEVLMVIAVILVSSAILYFGLAEIQNFLNRTERAMGTVNRSSHFRR